MSSQRMFAIACLSILIVQICSNSVTNTKSDDELLFEIPHLRPVLYGPYDSTLDDVAYEKRSSETDNNSERNIRSPLGTMRFGKRDSSPLGTMRFGKREPSPLGTMRFGKRSQSPLGTMRFGKRDFTPLGTMRFGKRTPLDYEFKMAPLGTMRFGKRSAELDY